MMEDNFRNTLIILSAVIIAAIFIHGLWTIRKNKNPYKLKTGITQVEPIYRDFDHSGFDQDGVSEARATKQTALTGEIDHPPEEEQIPNKPAPAPIHNEEPLPVDVAAQEEPMPELDTKPMMVDHEVSMELTETIEETIENVYDEPVIQAKPKSQVNAEKSKAAAKKGTVKKNQFELNFDDEIFNDRQEPTLGEQTDVQFEVRSEVIVISVVMPEGHLILGASLLPSLLTLGMKYGDMNIFHRHEDSAGNGSITFSLANMMNPGTFDLDNIENFTTQGVSLFMTLPNVGDPFHIFEQMLSAAKQLGQEFRGQILDDKRSVMTKQTEQHYINKIREFERKNRIASV